MIFLVNCHFLQKRKNWKSHVFMFLDVSLEVFELQRRTVPHFKAKVIIYNSSFDHEAFRQKLGLLHTKKSDRIICINPLHTTTFKCLHTIRIL